MALNKELLDILVCPKCKKPVEPTEDWSWLDCKECNLRYEVRNGVPIMLVDQAQSLDS